MIVLIALLAAATPSALDKSCQAGKAAACRELADRSRSGRGVPQDDKRAAQLWKRACKLGDADGCADDALAQVLGTGQYAEPVPALAKLEKLCKAGRQLACANLGSLFAQGFGKPTDAARAPKLLSDACDKSVPAACRTLAIETAKKNDFDGATRLADRACLGGDADGCVVAGDLFNQSSDVLRAGVAYSRACDAGVPAGCFGQAMILIQTGTDRERGLQLLHKACLSGVELACSAELNPEL